MEDKKIDILIDWKFDTHYATEKEHGLLHTAEYKGVQIRRETHTKYRNGKPGKRVFATDVVAQQVNFLEWGDKADSGSSMNDYDMDGFHPTENENIPF